MLENLKKEVCKANLDLVKYGLVLFTWGNVSAIDRKLELVVIKPSGVNYDVMSDSDMVVVDLDGRIVEGKLKPSSDLATHLQLYKTFKNIGGITHTHSTYATAFAQSKTAITFYGTTHADYFHGDIPCTRALTKAEVETDYEKNTGLVIAETFKELDPLEVPAVLVASHGVFTFGTNADNAVQMAAVTEEVAKMAYLTKGINPQINRADQYLSDKHYFRKHGSTAYYGQKK